MVAWAATAVVTVAALYFLKPKSSPLLPPKPRQGFWHVFSQMYDGNTPYFLMKVAREVSKVFTLHLLFGLKVIVVADATVARQILEHPESKKWLIAYEFIDHVAQGSTFFASEDIARYKHVRKSTLQAFSPQNVQNKHGSMIRYPRRHLMVR